MTMTVQDCKLSDKPSSAASWSLGGEGKEKGGTANRYGRHVITEHVMLNTYSTTLEKKYDRMSYCIILHNIILHNILLYCIIL